MSAFIFRCFGFLVLLQVLVVANIAFSAEVAANFNEQVLSWEQTLERVGRRVESGRAGSLEERDLRTKIQDIADAALAERNVAFKQVEKIKELIAALGAQPTVEGGKSEAEAIQERRKELSDELASQESRVKQTGFIIAKVELIQTEIGQRSRERLKATLFERTVTPLSLKAWAITTQEGSRLFDASFIELPAKWLSGIRGSPDKQTLLLRNILIALAVAIASWFLGRWLRMQYGRVQGIKKPSYIHRLLAGLAEGGGRALAPIVFVILTGLLVVEGDLIEDGSATIIQALEKNLILFFLSYALINAALTPQRIQWRLLDFGKEASRMLVFRLKLTLVIFLVFDGLQQSVSWATPSAELVSVWTLVFTLTMAPLLISLMDSRIWSGLQTDEAPTGRKASLRLRGFRIFLTLVLAMLPVAAVLGYSGLASYVTRAVVMSGLALGGLGLLRSIGRESLAAFLDSNRPIGQRVRAILDLDNKASQQALFWFGFLLDFVLLVVSVVVFLHIWGLGAEETAASAAKILRGIKVGSYTLSIIDVLIGLFLFVVIVLSTHYLQRGLDRHILPNLTQDRGARDALKTGVGYIGIVIAALVAISVIGLDLTNLALIAGALSVGIGFGLQNVVNNFVSGLILLAERPIKPGDWVVIGSHEGTVKKVNVRSTEIETFQRASVIIPNADLISNPVVNWTHKNILGRVEVTVGVAYGTDPQLVKSVMLDCAKANTNIILNPEPNVLFTDFGDSSLNFELRAYLADVEKRLQTASDLRFSINEAFKEKGIQIPFPQRDLHFASLPPELQGTKG